MSLEYGSPAIRIPLHGALADDRSTPESRELRAISTSHLVQRAALAAPTEFSDEYALPKAQRNLASSASEYNLRFPHLLHGIAAADNDSPFALIFQDHAQDLDRNRFHRFHVDPRAYRHFVAKLISGLALFLGGRHNPRTYPRKAAATLVPCAAQAGVSHAP